MTRSKKIIPAILTCCALAFSGAALAQAGSGGSAGDGDKPLNPANKTNSGAPIDATKDMHGNSTTKHPHPVKKAKKKAREASSAMSSAMSSAR